MPQAVTHPADTTLAAFALGKLSDAEAQTVADHVRTCDTCQLIAEQTPADSLIEFLRKAPAASTPPTGLTASFVAASALVDAPDAFRDHSRYRLLKRLGTGGMGEVYQAQHVVMDRLVAVKVIKPEFVSNAEAVARFQGEVRAAAKLDHPNIVRAFDAEELNGAHFLVMEFVPGATLAAYVEKKGPLPIALACSLVPQAALGLHHAHAKGMTHRDIKPQNLMVTRAGQVKVMDFGLVKVRNALGRATSANVVMGTPEYMAPEQARSGEVDARTDIYALGCTLFFLLTGRPPFAIDEGENHLSVMVNKTVQDAPDVRTLRSDVPTDLAALIAAMLAREPGQRPVTAKGVAVALAEQKKPAAEPTNSFVGLTFEPAVRPVRRRNWSAIVGLAMGFVAIGLLEGLVIRLRTASGTIVLTLTDPTADVFIDGEQLTVRKAGSEPIEVRTVVGQHKVQVKMGGVGVWGEEVAVNAGKATEVRAHWVANTEKTRLLPLPPKPNLGEPPSDYSGIATGRWVAALASVEDYTRLEKETAFIGVFPTFQNGILSCNRGTLFFPPLVAKDAIIRTRLNKPTFIWGTNSSLSLRRDKGDRVAAWCNGDGWFGIGRLKKSAGGWKDLATCKLAKRDDFFEFTFAAVGNRLIAYVDKHSILDTTYDAPVDAPGAIGVGGIGQFKDIDIQVLDK